MSFSSCVHDKCKKRSTLLCGKCFSVTYCCKFHQEIHWDEHFKPCLLTKHFREKFFLEYLRRKEILISKTNPGIVLDSIYQLFSPIFHTIHRMNIRQRMKPKEKVFVRWLTKMKKEEHAISKIIFEVIRFHLDSLWNNLELGRVETDSFKILPSAIYLYPSPKKKKKEASNLSSSLTTRPLVQETFPSLLSPIHVEKKKKKKPKPRKKKKKKKKRLVHSVRKTRSRKSGRNKEDKKKSKFEVIIVKKKNPLFEEYEPKIEPEIEEEDSPCRKEEEFENRNLRMKQEDLEMFRQEQVEKDLQILELERRFEVSEKKRIEAEVELEKSKIQFQVRIDRLNSTIRSQEDVILKHLMKIRALEKLGGME